jgi:hypothetical protein
MTSAVHYAAHAQNLEAERSVLGAILLDERSLHGVLDVGLHDDDFYRPAHGRVFAAMRALHSAGEAIDHLTVAAHLQRNGELDDIGGAASVDELAGWVPAAGHCREYAAIVHDLAQVRRLMRATYEIQAGASAPHLPTPSKHTEARHPPGSPSHYREPRSVPPLRLAGRAAAIRARLQRRSTRSTGHLHRRVTPTGT